MSARQAAEALQLEIPEQMVTGDEQIPMIILWLLASDVDG